MLGIAFICLLVFFAGAVIGKLFADISKNKAELADPEVYEIERRIYWLENVHLAYNKIKKIFDDSPDKFKCLKLSIQTEPYNHNRFYCRYRSIGNKYVIKMSLGVEDTPFFMIEENWQ